MEHNYLLNPAIRMLVEQIEPGSLEREVQIAYESLLWTVFPASDHWMTSTKYKQGATEPDNKTSKIIQYQSGWAPIDVLVGELKRPRERVNLGAFNTVAHDLLDDHMSESTNPRNTTLFGFVGLGAYVVFYSKVLPHGNLSTTQDQPLHIIRDAASVQQYFDYYKSNVPRWPSPDDAPDPAPPRPDQGSHAYSAPAASYQASALASTSSYYQAPAPGPSYEAPTSSYYQAPASSHPAPGPEAPTSSYPAPASGFQEGDNELETQHETQQTDIVGADYYTVEVRRDRHMTRQDEFLFTDKSGKLRVTTREDWHKTRLNGERCWIYHRKYVCYRDIFRK